MSQLRIDTGLISVLSGMVSLSMVSIHSSSCFSTYLPSRSLSLRMTSGATLAVLFSSAILSTPSPVNSCSTRLERINKFKGTGSPFANTFMSAGLSAGSSGCPCMGYPDLASHLLSGSLSLLSLSKKENHP